MEISSQHTLTTTTRGGDATRPSSVSFNSVSPTQSSNTTDAPNEEQSAAQKREERQNEREIANQLQQLQSRDREVRAHEAAHIAAGGRYVSSGAQYTYQRGPNGRFYAVGGEVQIDVSAIPSDPRATLAKAETIHRAALAPAQPSPQDLRVASNAAQLASRARVEIALQQREQMKQNIEANTNSKDKSDSTNQGDSVDTGSSSDISVYSETSLATPARDVFDIIA